MFCSNCSLNGINCGMKEPQRDCVFYSIDKSLNQIAESLRQIAENTKQVELTEAKVAEPINYSNVGVTLEEVSNALAEAAKKLNSY